MQPQLLVPKRLIQFVFFSSSQKQLHKTSILFTSEEANATASFVLSSSVWIQEAKQKRQAQAIAWMVT